LNYYELSISSLSCHNLCQTASFWFLALTKDNFSPRTAFLTGLKKNRWQIPTVLNNILNKQSVQKP